MNRIHAALTTVLAAVALCGTAFTGAATADPVDSVPTQELPQDHWRSGDTAKMPACAVLAPGAGAEAEAAVAKACAQIGLPYSWGGGHGPTPGPSFGSCDAGNGAPNDCHVKGLDCSGLTRFAYWQATGVDMGAGATRYRWNSDPRVARFMASAGTGPLLPGDLLYFGNTAATIHHTAMYLGNGYIVEAPYSGAHVWVNTVSAHGDYYGALRPYPAGGGTTTAAGPMFHEIRSTDGQSWTGFQPLAGYNTTQAGDAKDMSIAAMPDGSAQVLIVGADNRVYHEIRNADGQSWTGLQPLAGKDTEEPAMGKRVSITGMPDGSAQILIVGWDNVVYHEIRNADGSWTGFQPLSGYNTPNPAGAKDVAIAGLPDGSAQVLIVGADDRVYHEIRNANGQSWTGLQPLPGYQTPNPAGAKRVTIAGMADGSAQVLIVGADDRVYHEIRNANGNWTGFQPLPGYQTPDPAAAKDVAITGTPDGAAQVLIVGWDNHVYHQIRNADGQSWTGFQPLAGNGTTDPAGGSAVSIAGMSDGSAQVVIVGQRR